ncbi:hypothetical protein FRC09_020765, partial [Ceratobasidium sp. 395]
GSRQDTVFEPSIPQIKRLQQGIDRDTENAPSGNGALSEYVPSDKDDDADPTYGAPKTRRVPSSHGTTHSRTASNADKPARAGGSRRQQIDAVDP